ncbi:MAG: hypothetical protein MRY21_08270 [Simkaniaceae bacterium]|nr:hypothetical protein [Simkaniaceae bacterium]
MSREDEIKSLKAMNASLESQIDQLEAELGYLQTLLIDVGFADGIETLKMAIAELQETTA